MAIAVEARTMIDLTETTEKGAHLETVKEALATQIETITADINLIETDVKVAVRTDEAIEIAEATHVVTVEKDETIASLGIDQTEKEVTLENETTM